MPKKKKSVKPKGIQLPAEVMAARRGLNAGVHADQSTRRFGAGVSNRVGTRSAQVRSSIRHHGW